MYCGNCGKKIESLTAFCPDCGAPIDTKNMQQKIDSKRRAKILGIAIVGVAILGAIFIGLRVYSYIKSIPTDEQIQTAVNNIQNGGLVATDGKWLYYDDNGLCKVRLKDGTKQSVVSRDISPEEMFYVGDSLYYFSFMNYYKLEKNSDSGEDLGFSAFTQNCFQTDGKNYYITGFGNVDDENGVYSVKVGNSKKVTQISNISPSKIYMYDDYLYVISRFDLINEMKNENQGTWRMDKDGKNKIFLFDLCPDYMVFSGDTIYYTDRYDTICSMKLDGSCQEVYEGTEVGGGLNVSEEYVFYIDYTTYTIHRMDKDGSNNMELNQEKSAELNIIGEWIFYKNQSYDNKIYKMNFDGSYNQPIY